MAGFAATYKRDEAPPHCRRDEEVTGEPAEGEGEQRAGEREQERWETRGGKERAR